MKLAYTLILIALFAVGCNRNQTEVASAADAASETESACDPLDMECVTDGETVLADTETTDIANETTDESDSTDRTADELDGTTDVAETETEPEPEPEPEPEIEEPLAPSWANQPAERLAAAVKDIGLFGDRAVVPLAHFRNGARDVVIAWPIHDGSGQLSSTVYGVCVELLEDDSYTNCGDTWIVNEATSATRPLERALGTAEFEILTEQSSIELDTLSERIVEHGNSFVNAAGQNDTDALFEAARAFAGLIPVVDRTFNNSVASLLVAAAENNRVFWHVKTEVGDEHASITFKVRQVRTDMATFDLTAARADSRNQWNVIDYW